MKMIYFNEKNSKVFKKKNLFGDAIDITNFLKNKKLNDISQKNKIKVIKYRKIFIKAI